MTMKTTIIIKTTSFFLSACLLSGCISTGRYSQYKDSAPVRPPTQLEMKDAKVTDEPVGKSNRPYTIRGIDYTPQTKRAPFSEVGIASWYGKKFHGHLTSNGEVYDMYGMTAAHKTLPLPSFVKVTNLSNHRSAIVRVNDRGPFHPGRIIDLSYSAAHKLGVFDTGTAKVKIDVILPGQTSHEYRVSLPGFASLELAQESAKGLSLLLHQEAKTQAQNGDISLYLGPYKRESEALEVLKKVQKLGFNQAQISLLAPQ